MEVRDRSTERAGRVLLAEDNADLRMTLAALLREGGLEVVECENGLDLAAMLDPDRRGDGFDALITDIRMLGITGMEVLEGLDALEKRCPVILITGYSDDETRDRAEQMGAAALLEKPLEAETLLGEVRRAMEHSPG